MVINYNIIICCHFASIDSRRMFKRVMALFKENVVDASVDPSRKSKSVGDGEGPVCTHVSPSCSQFNDDIVKLNDLVVQMNDIIVKLDDMMEEIQEVCFINLLFILVAPILYI